MSHLIRVTKPDGRRLAFDIQVMLLVIAMVLVLGALATSLEIHAVLLILTAVLGGCLVLQLVVGRRHGISASNRWRHLASHDALTGLPNRATFIDRLERSWGRSGEVAVLYIDLDGFKAVNDTLGHAVGDDLLIEVANRLSNGLRERDVAARFGGDEFVAFLADCGRADALDVAERLRCMLSAPYHLNGREVVISASIGVCLPGVGVEPTDAMHRADLALYRAKEDGRDVVREFDAGLAEDTDLWHAAAEELATALRHDRLRLVYQPEVDLVTGEVVSVEALLRTDTLSQSALPLDRLITALEERGLGTQLTEWVLDHALADAAHWRSLGWEGRVSINVSGRALGEGDLVAQVAHALCRHDLPGEALTLEFPESGLKGLREGSARVLDRLRDMGVRATLDDFGSGTSSLDLLRRFPWDYLKVERSLVTDDAGLAIPLARLCGELGHVVIAEGIETNDQLDEQRLAGVRRGQGYLLAAPLRPEDLQVVLAVGSVVLPA